MCTIKKNNEVNIYLLNFFNLKILSNLLKKSILSQFFFHSKVQEVLFIDKNSS